MLIDWPKGGVPPLFSLVVDAPRIQVLSLLKWRLHWDVLSDYATIVNHDERDY
jgi:hypothetical protein